MKVTKEQQKQYYGIEKIRKNLERAKEENKYQFKKELDEAIESLVLEIHKAKIYSGTMQNQNGSRVATFTTTLPNGHQTRKTNYYELLNSLLEYYSGNFRKTKTAVTVRENFDAALKQKLASGKIQATCYEHELYYGKIMPEDISDSDIRKLTSEDIKTILLSYGKTYPTEKQYKRAKTVLNLIWEYACAPGNVMEGMEIPVLQEFNYAFCKQATVASESASLDPVKKTLTDKVRISSEMARQLSEAAADCEANYSIISPEEMASVRAYIWDWINGTEKDAGLGFATLLASYTGLTPQELAVLTWEDVSHGSITVRRCQLESRTSSERYYYTASIPERRVPLTLETQNILTLLKHMQDAEGIWSTNGLVFLQSTGNGFTENAVTRFQKKVYAESGISCVSVEALKAYCNKHVLKPLGINSTECLEILGLKSVA